MKVEKLAKNREKGQTYAPLSPRSRFQLALVRLRSAKIGGQIGARELVPRLRKYVLLAVFLDTPGYTSPHSVSLLLSSLPTRVPRSVAAQHSVHPPIFLASRQLPCTGSAGAFVAGFLPSHRVERHIRQPLVPVLRPMVPAKVDIMCDATRFFLQKKRIPISSWGRTLSVHLGPGYACRVVSPPPARTRC